MKTFKRWLIYKLGGILIQDLPVKIQFEILNTLANNTIDTFWSKSFIDEDKSIKDILKNHENL